MFREPETENHTEPALERPIWGRGSKRVQINVLFTPDSPMKVTSQFTSD